jgi:hypothetical protein
MNEPKKPPQQWGYFVRPLQAPHTDNAQLAAELNRLGQDGWELVQIAAGLAVFKQPLS